jgi:hypothetical protein
MLFNSSVQQRNKVGRFFRYLQTLLWTGNKKHDFCYSFHLNEKSDDARLAKSLPGGVQS